MTTKDKIQELLRMVSLEDDVTSLVPSLSPVDELIVRRRIEVK